MSKIKVLISLVFAGLAAWGWYGIYQYAHGNLTHGEFIARALIAAIFTAALLIFPFLDDDGPAEMM